MLHHYTHGSFCPSVRFLYAGIDNNRSMSGVCIILVPVVLTFSLANKIVVVSSV